MLRMSVEMRAEGKGEKYAGSIPTYTCKEDLKQAIEDDMLIRNSNFVQSAELVCSQPSCTSLISLLNYSLINLMCYFAGSHDYQEYDLPTSRVSDSAKGCGEVAALCPIGHFSSQGAKRFLNRS